MAKKSLFTNYTFEFDKNEIKIISNFCKQAVSQMQGDNKFAGYVNAFNSILDKLHSGEEKIKLTKQERQLLIAQLKENIKFIDGKIAESWIIKRWFYRSIRTQYQMLIDNHFSD